MPNLEVAFLVFWMELSWAIRMKLYIVYLAIPPFFYLISYAIQRAMGSALPFPFLPGAVAFAYLLTSFLIAFGFVQRGKSFWNLSRLAGSPPLFIYIGELTFSAFIALVQSLIFFYLIRVGTGIGGFGSFFLFLIFSIAFSLLFTAIYLLFSLLAEFEPLRFTYIGLGLLLFLVIFSNLFISIYSLPFPVRFIAFLNPLTYGTEGINRTFGVKGNIPFSNLPLIFGIYISLFVFLLYLLAKKERL